MKKIFALLLVLVLAFSMISCDGLLGGNSGDGTNEGNNDAGNNGGNTGNNGNANNDPTKENDDKVVDTPIIDWEAD